MSATHKLALLFFVSLTLACDSISGLVDPMRGVETLADVEFAEDTNVAQLIGTDETVADLVEEALEAQEPSEPGGLFGFFRRTEPRDPALGQEVAAEPSGGGNAESFEPIEASAQVGGGLFDFLQWDSADVAEDVAPEGPLTFGMLRAACGVKQRDLGEVVTSASGFKVYDSAPGGTSLRPHYVTGFDDGCPREFLAALVLLGDVGTHEIVRYAGTRVQLDYSKTDLAYERIKARFCRVGEGKPCGDRLESLGRVTTFVTAYETFGAGPVWAEFLLHDGAVAAVDLERR